MDLKADVVIVGGGLTGCLLALKLIESKPDLQVVLLEETEKFGGHRTWSFHSSDIGGDNAQVWSWLAPLVSRSWEESNVEFPRLKKTRKGRYHSIRSEDLHKAIKDRLGNNAISKARAERLSESHVELANGDIVAGRCVLDCRGLMGEMPQGVKGYQKSIGIDFTFEAPHGLKSPLIMDATCPQLDGFRYFQILPWNDTRLMVEETFYSDSGELNLQRIERSIRSYVERRGWKIKSQDRIEKGVMPIPMTSEYIMSSVGGEPLPLGTRGGYFHATTGHALPEALRLIEFLSSLEDLSTNVARDKVMRFRRSFISRQRFYRLLNRLLFYASEPSLRYMVFSQFFELPDDVIQRFFAGTTTWSDRLRIFSGRPPIPFDRALRSLTERSIQSWADARSNGGTARES